MYVVGGHGYVGSRVIAFASLNQHEATAVSRDGDERRGIPSIAWADFIAGQAKRSEPTSVVWLLDGAKHAEPERLEELLGAARPSLHIALVSSCTVYGDRNGESCTEETPLSLVTANAKLKATCEEMVTASHTTWSIMRLGALYGPDDRGVRRDRVEKWVTEASTEGTVTIPAPSHWRGWLHREQAARSLYRVAIERLGGTFNVSTSNYRLGDAAGFAAALFGATVRDDGKIDPLNYTINAGEARNAKILDERPGEDIASTVASFVRGKKINRQ